MSRMMSRRAILRAIGLSPVALATLGASRRGQAPAMDRWVIKDYWEPSFNNDLARVVAEGKIKYRRHFGAEWDEVNEKAVYRRLARSLYSFYLAGIDKRVNEPGGRPLNKAPGLFDAAFKYPSDMVNSGIRVVENLRTFVQDHDDTGSWADETRLCAFRCGWLAADKEITDSSDSTEVSGASYSFAWNTVRTFVDDRFEKMKAQGTVGILKAGGAC